MDTNTVLKTKTFRPVGVSNEFNQAVTLLLHRLLMADAKTTLDRIGYIASSAMVVDGKLQIKMYFDSELATTTVRQKGNGKATWAPKDELRVLEGWVIDTALENWCTIESAVTPKYKVETTDDVSNEPVSRVVFKEAKKNGKNATETNRCLIVNCSPMVTLAALVDIDLYDPEYTFNVVPVVNEGKSEKVILTAGSQTEIPATICISCSDDPKYQHYTSEDIAKRVNFHINTVLKKRDLAKINSDKLSKKAEEKTKKQDKKQKQNGVSLLYKHS